MVQVSNGSKSADILDGQEAIWAKKGYFKKGKSAKDYKPKEVKEIKKAAK